MSNLVRTRLRGTYINNDDLQKMLLKDSWEASMLGYYETSDYLSKLVNKLETLKD